MSFMGKIFRTTSESTECTPLLPHGGQGQGQIQETEQRKAPSSLIDFSQPTILGRIGNDLVEISPECLTEHRDIEELSLRDNSFLKLKDLPGVHKLGKLIILDLSNTNEKFIVENIDKFKKVQQLDLSNNRLGLGIPPAIMAVGKQWHAFINLQKLDLSKNGLQSLPNVEKLVNLRELDASSNALQSLPHSFARLQKLAILRLGHNGFESIPDEIADLENLEELYLENNEIAIDEHTPELQCDKLKKLRIVNLNANNIERIPQEIVSFASSLEELYLDNNKIIVLPSKITKCENLEILSLRVNKLAYILPWVSASLQRNGCTLLTQGNEKLFEEQNPCPIV